MKESMQTEWDSQKNAVGKCITNALNELCLVAFIVKVPEQIAWIINKFFTNFSSSHKRRRNGTKQTYFSVGLNVFLSFGWKLEFCWSL